MIRKMCVLVILTGVAMAAESAAVSADPPNVVMIVSDDQTWTDFGFMGHEVIQTPHLDRFASQSALFPRGYVPSSLCRPSLATLISGLYPHQHKITGNDPPPGTDRAAMLKHIRRIPTLPRLLAKRGYASLQTGKWWEGSYKLGGFTDGMTHGDPQRGGRHGDEGLKIGRQGMQPILDFIDQRGEKPFFIWYAPFLPHRPHNPPKRLLEKYTTQDRPQPLARYYAMCEWFDETCGELFDYLDEKNLTERTLVVFVVDNGWIQRTPQTKVPDNWRFAFAPKSKRSPYDGGVRTPIILRWPETITPGRYDSLVSSIDLAPTILSAVGVKAPAEMPGIDLLRVIENDGQTDRKVIFGEIFSHDVSNIDNPAAGLQYRWGIEDHWKLILPTAPTQSPELFNLAEDPHETRNLAKAQPDRVERLKRLIDAWWPGKQADGSTE